MKFISFGVLGVITLCMIAATIVEKFYGSSVASLIYESPIVVVCWCVSAVLMMMSVVCERKTVSFPTLMLHASFCVILAGAAITWLSGIRGQIRLQEGDTLVSECVSEDSGKMSLPFDVGVQKAGIDYYPGTRTARDYKSDLIIRDSGKIFRGTVSMNNVLTHKGYRFYQTSIGRGYTVLTVYHDPYGIGVSYTGYILLLLSMIGFFFSKKSRFRGVLKALCAVIAIFVISDSTRAQTVNTEYSMSPMVLQKPLAKTFGNLHVYWNNRVCPLQTMAREFCLSVHGSDHFGDYTPEQVLTGWLFYYDSWKNTKFIKVKNKEIRDILGIEGKYASIKDFYDASGYKLDNVSLSENSAADLAELNEKIDLLAQVCTGAAWKIFPQKENGHYVWHSWVDKNVGEAEHYDNIMDFAMENVAYDIAREKFIAANDEVKNIIEWQEKFRDEKILPSEIEFGAEKTLNSLPSILLMAVLAFIAGIAGFVMFVRGRKESQLFRGKGMLRKIMSAALPVVEILLFAYLTFVCVLRWIVGGHIPLSNGYETMTGIAWFALLMTIAVSGRFAVLKSMSAIVSGLALCVAVMGEGNPAVTKLVPVLASPLLSVHVMLVMTSYSIFAIMALNSIVALASDMTTRKRLADICVLLLYPAEFCLIAGIFIGAIWANNSWGRYWGWDPKETWALITMIVYCLPMHAATFKALQRPKYMCIFCIIAFFFVLFTYFGVNYLLTGLHSYA
ncbi:MAG: cytochrome c biogenesis protein CcsA [Candidatus Amulumruptor caecigallinarius]|nr:cytochrome c biogenesis protein CcsA [Candidatus Amulumruptor caecigallinarius]